MAKQTELVAVEEALPESNGEEVSSLIRLALEQKVDVEILERLVALQERVTEKNARAAFFLALSEFQEHCPEIHKSKRAEVVSKKTGTKFSYSFAPLETITRTIRPVLKDHGLSYSWDVELDGTVLNVACILRHIDGHSERARFPVPIETDARMSGAQANGAALTYGRRQSLIAVLGLTAAEDTDAVEPGSQETITAEQEADLLSLIEEVGADLEKFKKWQGVESLSEILVDDYNGAVAALERKRGRS